MEHEKLMIQEIWEVVCIDVGEGVSVYCLNAEGFFGGGGQDIISSSLRQFCCKRQ